MNTYTFIADWVSDYGLLFPPVIVTEGHNELDARFKANEVATRVLAKHIDGMTNLFENDGYVVAVFEGDVSGSLVSTHSMIDARTGKAVIRL